jgi:hypothetical protein
MILLTISAEISRLYRCYNVAQFIETRQENRKVRMEWVAKWHELCNGEYFAFCAAWAFLASILLTLLNNIDFITWTLSASVSSLILFEPLRTALVLLTIPPLVGVLRPKLKASPASPKLAWVSFATASGATSSRCIPASISPIQICISSQ